MAVSAAGFLGTPAADRGGAHVVPTLGRFFENGLGQHRKLT
jgi:hypothetical protein